MSRQARLGLVCTLLCLAAAGRLVPVRAAANPALWQQTGGACDFSFVDEIRYSPWELVTALAWAPDGNILAVAAGNSIRLVDADGAPIARFDVPALSHELAFSPDGRRLAAASNDGLVRVWRMPAADQAPPEWTLSGHRKGANVVVFSPDSATLASGGNDGIARIWELESGVDIFQLIGGSLAVPGLAFNPGGDTLAMINGEYIRLREAGSQRISGTLRAETSLFNLAYSPDGIVLAASDSANQVLLFDPELAFRTGQETYPEPRILSGHSGAAGSFRALVWQVQFSPDGACLASAGGDGTALLWDMAGGQLSATLAGHTRAVTSVAFRPDGDGLATGSLDGSVRFYSR